MADKNIPAWFNPDDYEEVQEVPAWFNPDDYEEVPAKGFLSNALDTAGAVGANALHSATFNLDKPLLNVVAPSIGKAYGDYLDRSQEEHPYASMAGTIGGFATGGGLVGAGLRGIASRSIPLVSKAAGLAGDTLLGQLGVNAAGDLVASTAESGDLGEGIEDAAWGAGLGLGVGGVAKAAAWGNRLRKGVKAEDVVLGDIMSDARYTADDWQEARKLLSGNSIANQNVAVVDALQSRMSDKSGVNVFDAAAIRLRNLIRENPIIGSRFIKAAEDRVEEEPRIAYEAFENILPLSKDPSSIRALSHDDVKLLSNDAVEKAKRFPLEKAGPKYGEAYDSFKKLNDDELSAIKESLPLVAGKLPKAAKMAGMEQGDLQSLRKARGYLDDQISSNKIAGRAEEAGDWGRQRERYDRLLGFMSPKLKEADAEYAKYADKAELRSRYQKQFNDLYENQDRTKPLYGSITKDAELIKAVGPEKAEKVRTVLSGLNLKRSTNQSILSQGSPTAGNLTAMEKNEGIISIATKLATGNVRGAASVLRDLTKNTLTDKQQTAIADLLLRTDAEALDQLSKALYVGDQSKRISKAFRAARIGGGRTYLTSEEDE